METESLSFVSPTYDAEHALHRGRGGRVELVEQEQALVGVVQVLDPLEGRVLDRTLIFDHDTEEVSRLTVGTDHGFAVTAQQEVELSMVAVLPWPGSPITAVGTLAWTPAARARWNGEPGKEWIVAMMFS